MDQKAVRRNLKRKLEQDFGEEKEGRKAPNVVETAETNQDLARQIRAHVDQLNSTFSSAEADRAAAKAAAQFLSDHARDGTDFLPGEMIPYIILHLYP